jgi:hypothetical protein
MAALTLVDVAAALGAAWDQLHRGRDVSEGAIVFPLAQVAGAEGSLSRYFDGTNNLGAIHATASFERARQGAPGYGAVAFLDHSPGGQPYITRMAVYPTLVDGAAALLQLIEAMGALEHTASSADYSAALYAHGYFEGMAAPATPSAQRAAAWQSDSWTDADRTNIAAYASAIEQNLPAARAAYQARSSYQGDPRQIVSGPPFASLADRLTPSPAYAPHTIEHARELLGAAADTPPPGAVALQDALDVDGIWMFGLPLRAPTRAAPAMRMPAPAIVAATAVVAAGAVLLAIVIARAAPAWAIT